MIWYLCPFVSAELPDFNLDHAINYGMLPPHYLAKNPTKRLSAYIDVYLKEEIKQEALVRNLSAFQRFLEVAALTDGEIDAEQFIAQKSFKAKGKRLTTFKLESIEELEPTLRTEDCRPAHSGFRQTSSM